MNRREFLRIGGMSMMALVLGGCGLSSLTGESSGGQAGSSAAAGTAAAAGAFLTNVRSQFLSDHKCGLLFMFFPVFWFSYPYRPEKNKKVLLLQNFFPVDTDFTRAPGAASPLRRVSGLPARQMFPERPPGRG